MTFPVLIEIGSLRISGHGVFELLAYILGFQLYLVLRRKQGDFLETSRRWTLVVAAIVGAALGSKILHLLGHPSLLAERWSDPEFLMGGKTIVGGLLGGTLAVELVKKHYGIRRGTGDLYALPLCLGIAVGRIGCFLGGLADRTYGVATTLPWGIDFGDGVSRHPTQLYEIAFLGLLALAIWGRGRRPHRDGDLFKLFMVGYLSWRLLVDFIKPYEKVLGLGVLQIACIAGLLYYARWLPRITGYRKEVVHG